MVSKQTNSSEKQCIIYYFYIVLAVVKFSEMASWKKFKNRITKDEIQVRPIYNQKELGERKQTGIGFKINGKEVIINDLQTKELICYLVSVPNY